jgi:hypothetical protein
MLLCTCLIIAATSHYSRNMTLTGGRAAHANLSFDSNKAESPAKRCCSERIGEPLVRLDAPDISSI